MPAHEAGRRLGSLVPLGAAAAPEELQPLKRVAAALRSVEAVDTARAEQRAAHGSGSLRQVRVARRGLESTAKDQEAGELTLGERVRRSRVGASAELIRLVVGHGGFGLTGVHASLLGVEWQRQFGAPPYPTPGRRVPLWVATRTVSDEANGLREARNNGQHHVRGVGGVEMNGVLSRHAVGVATHRLTGVGIQVEAREITTGDIQTNAVPGHE